MFKNSTRWRNAGLWISVISFVPILLEALGIKVLPDTWGSIKEALMAVISLLVVLGILSNPTNGNGFSDDHKGDKEVTSDGNKTKVDTHL